MRSIFWDIPPCSPLTDVSEEYVAYIFRVEEYAKQEIGSKLGNVR
jgi:hypothetical protein